jgi:YNFM family putative membrane transporter
VRRDSTEVGSGGAYPRMAAALFLAGLVTFAQLYSVQPLLPELADAFDVPDAVSPLALSMSTALLGASLLVVGPLSDVVGRTRLIQVSLWASAAVSALCVVAPTWTSLLVLRGLMGLALAGLPVAGMAYIREEVPAESHPRAAALYVAGTAVGGMTGRLVAGVLGDLGGWRIALAGITAIGVLSAVLVRSILPRSLHFAPAPRHRLHLARSAMGLVRTPEQLALYGIGAVFSGAFVVVYNAMAFRLVAPPYRLSLTLAGLVFVIYAVGAVSSVYAGAASSRSGPRRVLTACGLVTLAGVLTTLAAPLAVVTLGLAMVTAGFFGVHAVASASVANRTHPDSGGTGLAVSMYLFAYYVGSSVFGGLAGGAWTLGRWPAVASLAGCLVVLGTLFSLVVGRSPRHGG